MAVFRRLGGNDAIRSDMPKSLMPKSLAKLAPGRQQAHGPGIADDPRPDAALAVPYVLISIADPYLASMQAVTGRGDRRITQMI